MNKQYADQWAELAAKVDLGWTKRGRAGNDLSRRVGEAYNFSARAIDFDMQVRCGAVGLAELENILASAAGG
ncbi:MAG: hypothetical protein ACM3IH_13315, partial [Sphingobacteriales bacterium]